jgi:hypothetical protein
MTRRLLLILAVAGLLAADVVPGRPPTPEEMRLVLSAPVFVQWSRIGGLDPAKGFKLVTTTNNVNHSFRIKAEYEVKRPGESLVYFLSDAEIYGTRDEAAAGFKGALSGYRKGLARVRGASMEEKQPILTMGDQNFAAVLKQDGKPLGNFFAFTQGRVLHTLIVYGVVSTRHAQVRELFGPIYDESRRQFP